MIMECTRLVRPTEGLRIVTEDPEDDRILECAATARAQRIVSGDLDLRRLKDFRGAPVVTLADFMAELDHEPPPRHTR